MNHRPVSPAGEGGEVGAWRAGQEISPVVLQQPGTRPSSGGGTRGESQASVAQPGQIIICLIILNLCNYSLQDAKFSFEQNSIFTKFQGKYEKGPSNRLEQDKVVLDELRRGFIASNGKIKWSKTQICARLSLSTRPFVFCCLWWWWGWRGEILIERMSECHEVEIVFNCYSVHDSLIPVVVCSPVWWPEWPPSSAGPRPSTETGRWWRGRQVLEPHRGLPWPPGIENMPGGMKTRRYMRDVLAEPGK